MGAIVEIGPIFDLMPKPNKRNDMPKLFTTFDEEFEEETPLDTTELAQKKLRERQDELASRERKIRNDKREFITKFVDLYYYYLKSKNIDRNRSFYKIKLEPYTMKKFITFNIFGNYNHKLTVRNGKNILFKIGDDWYNDFSEFRIMKFDTSAVYELQEVHNILVDEINIQLKIREEALDELDLTNLSLKELI